ncbi:MAG: hypothetical protein AB7O39_03145 [Flavobacteriaceae bacterium]
MADFGLSAILALAGTAASAVGTIAAGSAQKDAKEFEALQQERMADEEIAASQREADRTRKERDFIMSRQQAVASSSGLGALDETVQDLAGDVAQEGALQAGMIRYGGEERAKGRRAQAAAARMEGKAAKTGSYFSAAGTIMKGMGSFADAYSQKKLDMGSNGSYNYRYG